MLYVENDLRGCNKMQRIKNRKKEGLPLWPIVIFIITVAVILLVLYFRVGANAKGLIEIGMSYNSNTKREKNNFLAKIEEKKENLEVEIYTNFFKEQEGDVLESLRINSEVQVNYYSTENTFYYTLAGYDRNIEQGIMDKTSMDIGAGYKDYKYKYPFRVQSGVSSRSIYYDSENLERNLYFSASGDIKYAYDLFDFKNELDFLINLKAIHGTDVGINNVSSIIANLSDNLFLSLSLDFSYLNHPPLGYPKEIKIYMIRGGFSF